jgi:hypothetical protein
MPEAFMPSPADVSAAGDARRFVHSRLADLTPDVSFVAKLLVDELVTNAVVHVHSSVVVALKTAAGMVQVEVSDSAAKCLWWPGRWRATTTAEACQWFATCRTNGA